MRRISAVWVALCALRVHLAEETAGPQPLSAGFFDGEDFVCDLTCVAGTSR